MQAATECSGKYGLITKVPVVSPSKTNELAGLSQYRNGESSKRR
jgi:hypothetical protein